MKNKLFLAILGFFLTSSFYAQRIVIGLDANQQIGGAKLIRYKDQNNFPAHIEFSNEKMGPRDLNSWMLAALKLPKGYGFQLLKEETDNIGFVHQDYQQMYQGLKVVNGIYKAHYKDNQLRSMNGEIYPVGDLSTTPTLLSTEAVLIAKNHVNAKRYKWQEGQHHSLDYYPTAQLMVLFHQKKAFLVYQVDIYSIEPLSRKYIYVDATTGEVITETERIHHADTPGTANTAYSGTRPIIMDFTGSNYRLYEQGRGLETVNYSTGLPYTNASTSWTLVGLDQYALDAHWGTEVTYDYYFNTYGRNGLDGAGYFLTSYVNEGPGFGNAFWDGSTVHYGDGDGSTFTTPLTSLGIVAHEMTHGLTQFTAGLVYANESGAMNESFSDIFGLAVDKYARNINLNLPSSWLVGAECTSGSGIRNMANPNAFGNADCYGGAFWNAGDIVHYDSGVQNFWFYLLTMGGTGTNDILDAYSVDSIGVVDAGAIAYRNLVYYLTPGSDFADSRYYSLIAAQDLFGACSPQVAAVADAWHAVGVGAPYQNVTIASFDYGNPLGCDLPILVNFTDLSFNADSYLWDFGDGDTSTLQNPSHQYLAAGTYNVQLISTGCGVNVADTFVTSVVITTTGSILNVDPAQNLDISCCTGTLFDSGGNSGDYTDGEMSYATINVPAGSVVVMDFISFDIEFSYDYVTIYDGPNASYPSLGSFTGNTLPNSGNPISSTGNQVYFEFTSDGSVIGPGFQMDWTCDFVALPAASFESNSTTICIGTSIEYYNTSAFESSVLWNFQGGSPNSSTLDTVSILYNTAGTYTTTLTATNINGTNSFTSTINVVALPVPSITVVGNVVSVSPAFASYQWCFNGSPIGGANAQSYNFTLNGNYYCEVTNTDNCMGTSAMVSTSVGIQDQMNEVIVLYPNPVSDMLYINNPMFMNGISSIELMNMIGEAIFVVNPHSALYSIDLSNVSAGSYMVRIRQNESSITKKIVVVK